MQSPDERRRRINLATKRYRQTEQGKIAHRRHNLSRYYRLKESGLCANCGKQPPVESFVLCQQCKDKTLAATTAWKARMVAEGLCNRCGKFPSLPAMKGRKDSFCERCYFRKTSTDCLKTAKHADVIGNKLKTQNYQCAYTREKIVLGLNDSLDHVLPISRFPELRSDPANTEWVTRKVNCMKWDSTREEFLETARLVVDNIH